MQKLEGAPDVKHMRGTNTTVLTVSLTHVLHTQENRPSEQLPWSNDTVNPRLASRVCLLPIGIFISI